MDPIVLHLPGKKDFQKSKEEALLANCKYFKGEAECPFAPKVGDNRRALWFVEESWYGNMLAAGDDAFAREVEEYDAYKVGDGLPADGRPKTLRARIFNRFAKGSYSMRDAVREFHTFYGSWYHPDEKDFQKSKEEALLTFCKYFKGEYECPYKDMSTAEACFWYIERIATREAALESSIMLSDAKAELSRVNLSETITAAIPAPILQVAFVLFGKQCSAPYWSDEFASEFETFLRGGYGANLV